MSTGKTVAATAGLIVVYQMVRKLVLDVLVGRERFGTVRAFTLAVSTGVPADTAFQVVGDFRFSGGF